MFSLSSVVESVFGTLAAEETMPQSRAHDEDRSATSTDTIDNPEDAKANVQELQDKQDEADGAEDEEEEEVPDVRLLSRSCWRVRPRSGSFSTVTLTCAPVAVHSRVTRSGRVRLAFPPSLSLSHRLAAPDSPLALCAV